MDARVQFRIDPETKRLAQQMASSQGRTLSDACRELIEQLAEQQRKVTSHNDWLTEQVNHAFDQLETNQSVFVDQQTAHNQMEQRKAAIRKSTK